MRRSTLARHLIDAHDQQARRLLLNEFRHLADEKLAAELRKACYAAWNVEPVRAQRAAAAARLLASSNPQPAIKAAAAWLRGISCITKGKFDAAVASLDEAAAMLTDRTDAAQVEVARLLALAMLSRYGEAISAGKTAHKAFVAAGDQLAAGKIEMNLSNVVSRQGDLRQAETYGVSALRRFTKIGEREWQAMAENSLANTYSDLHDLAKAEKFFARALATALGQKMYVTVAEIEASLGDLAKVRGRYADALRLLESSRQRYDELAMPHQSAIADLEIADIYLELNLLAEAIEIYQRVTPAFQRLKMRVEEARARLEYGRAAARLGDEKTAERELRKALRLFAAENNRPAQAVVLLSQAETALSEQRADAAVAYVRSALSFIRDTGNARLRVQLNLLEGQTFFASGHESEAEKKLLDAAADAKRHDQPAALQTAFELLGRLAASRGDARAAKKYFSRSIDVVEQLRSPLGAHEFGVAFFGSRLGPYESLAKLQLEQGRIADAFATVERGRSRSLLDALDKKSRRSRVPQRLSVRADELRAELNSRYKSLEHTGDDRMLLEQIKRIESELAKVDRQIASLTLAADINAGGRAFDLAEIQASLGDRTLVEFVQLDGVISAFVVDKDRTAYIDRLTTADEISALLEQLHFQFGSLRYGGAMSRFAAQLKDRADAVLIRLYDKLLRPINGVTNGRLVVVPVGPLHYVPFAALHDGEGYLVERFEITSAPSAAVWRELQHRKGVKFRSSLLIGHADERIPLVENEVRELSSIVPEPRVLTGEKATFGAFQAEAARHDLIHLACHGQFRPDNPMFSSLHLADGWVTVQDLTNQNLRAKLVTLSACETGLSKVFAGDELLGLARGFLAAGAASMVVSLWTVNDEAASRLMQRFYLSLQRGATPAASLKDAQNELITAGAHPYLWSPFVFVGR